MKYLIQKKSILITCLLTLFVISSCSNDDDNNIPTIEAAFTQTINNNTGTVRFLNTSTNADNYLWDFGDGTTSTEINPVKTYPTGTYTVVLTVTNFAGASATFEDTILISIPGAPVLPITFDDSNINYEATTFNGTSFEVVTNPDLSGSNTTASNVGAITNTGNAFEGISFDLGDLIDLTELKTIKMNVWSDAAVDVLLKLEQGSEADIEIASSHGGTGWEEVFFSFDSSAEYGRLTLFLDGPGTSTGTFYIDDISQINTSEVPCTDTLLEFPIDFDCNGIDYASKIVGNVSFMVVENPELSGINNQETMVGQITNVGANWENAFFNLDTPIQFSDTNNAVRIKFFSSVAVPILLKFEDGTEAPVETSVNHTGSGWEELTFAFTSTASYNDMVIFVDGPGTTAGTFYVDDIEQTSVTVTPPFDDGLLTNGDFQSGTSPWTLGTENAVTADLIVADGTNNFLSINVTAAGNPFDVNLSQTGLDMTEGTTYILSFDAWSDVNRDIIAGIGLSGAPFTNQAQTVSITTTRTRYTLNLTANFTDNTNSRVLFDLGAQIGMVNLDNVSLFEDTSGGGGCTTGAVAATSLPLDFESCESFISAFSSIGDGGVVPSLDANPSQSGINTSANVLKVVRASGINRWGGIQNSFPAGTIDITTNTFKIKVYTSLSDVTYRFELALDPQTDPVTGNPPPTFVTVNGGANTWTEIEFTFTGLPASPTTYNQLVIKPDNPTGSDGETTSAEQTFYFDDLRLD